MAHWSMANAPKSIMTKALMRRSRFDSPLESSKPEKAYSRRRNRMKSITDFYGKGRWKCESDLAYEADENEIKGNQQ